MLRFIAQRWQWFGAAAVIALIAAALVWYAWSAAPWAAAVLGVSFLVAGLGALAFLRLGGAVRELFREVSGLRHDVEQMREELKNFAPRDFFDSEAKGLGWRLSLAERRLAKLAVKLEMTDEAEEPWS